MGCLLSLVYFGFRFDNGRDGEDRVGDEVEGRGTHHHHHRYLSSIQSLTKFVSWLKNSRGNRILFLSRFPSLLRDGINRATIARVLPIQCLWRLKEGEGKSFIVSTLSSYLRLRDTSLDMDVDASSRVFPIDCYPRLPFLAFLYKRLFPIANGYVRTHLERILLPCWRIYFS